MIRINLLSGPRTRKAKGQWGVELELAATAVLLVLTLVACFVYAGMLNDQIEERQTRKQEKSAEIAKLREQVKKVQQFEAKKKRLEKLIRIIAQLEKNRKGPVRILDVMSQSVEPVKVWLTKLSMKGKKIDLSGVALANEDVVGFVNNLRGADKFAKVQLLEIRAGKQRKVKVFKFKLKLALKGKDKGKGNKKKKGKT